MNFFHIGRDTKIKMGERERKKEKAQWIMMIIISFAFMSQFNWKNKTILFIL